MNIGSLYLVKKYFWLLFPTKKTADAAYDFYVGGGGAMVVAAGPFVTNYAYWLSGRLNCEVTYFSPDSIIVFLEEDGIYKKVLTSDGKIGWIWFSESHNNCFEEAKTEQ